MCTLIFTSGIHVRRRTPRKHENAARRAERARCPRSAERIGEGCFRRRHHVRGRTPRRMKMGSQHRHPERSLRSRGISRVCRREILRLRYAPLRMTERAGVIFGIVVVRRAILDRGRLARSAPKGPKCAAAAMNIAVPTGAKMRARRPRSKMARRTAVPRIAFRARHRPDQDAVSIFMLAWCAYAHMTSASKITFCRPKASNRVCSGRGFGPFCALHFHACAVCAQVSDST